MNFENECYCKPKQNKFKFKIIKESKNYSPNQMINANNSTKSSDNEKDHYTKLDNINNFLDEFYPKFKENFELTNYINCGGTGIVYEGLLKKGKKKQKLAFKFKIIKY